MMDVSSAAQPLCYDRGTTKNPGTCQNPNYFSETTERQQTPRSIRKYTRFNACAGFWGIPWCDCKLTPNKCSSSLVTASLNHITICPSGLLGLWQKQKWRFENNVKMWRENVFLAKQDEAVW